MKKNIQFVKFYKAITDEVQVMEDIGGPDTLEEYITVLTAVKLDIEERIKVAAARKVAGDL